MREIVTLKTEGGVQWTLDRRAGRNAWIVHGRYGCGERVQFATYNDHDALSFVGASARRV